MLPGRRLYMTFGFNPLPQWTKELENDNMHAHAQTHMWEAYTARRFTEGPVK